MRWNARARRERRKHHGRCESGLIGQRQGLEQRGGLRTPRDRLFLPDPVSPQPERTPQPRVIQFGPLIDRRAGWIRDIRRKSGHPLFEQRHQFSANRGRGGFEPRQPRKLVPVKERNGRQSRHVQLQRACFVYAFGSRIDVETLVEACQRLGGVSFERKAIERDWRRCAASARESSATTSRA